jgi:hypothetical protein
MRKPFRVIEVHRESGEVAQFSTLSCKNKRDGVRIARRVAAETPAGYSSWVVCVQTTRTDRTDGTHFWATVKII